MAPVYTEAQVAQFLHHLEIPTEYYTDDEPILDLAFLAALHAHMITTVPHETLLMRDSKHGEIDLDPQVLFQKIVADGRGRGGNRLEGGLLFLYMLRALGFQVYPVGARVRQHTDGVPQGGYLGWAHIINIVTLPDNTQWALDVSFGGPGPTRPMRLTEGTEWRNFGTQNARLIRDFIPGQTELNPGNRLWLYQSRNGVDEPWVSFYAFSEKVEWLPGDFDLLRVGGMGDVVVKFVRERGKVCGVRMLDGNLVRERLAGKTRIVTECQGGEERIGVLRELFGIELREE